MNLFLCGLKILDFIWSKLPRARQCLLRLKIWHGISSAPRPPVEIVNGGVRFRRVERVAADLKRMRRSGQRHKRDESSDQQQSRRRASLSI
jgi:hypothetical protein